MNNLENVNRVHFEGSTVQFLRSTASHTGWCAMAYEQGLPVASRTITEDQVVDYMQRRKHWTSEW